MTAPLPFHDPDLSIEARLDDLLPRLTLAEKAAQMLHEAPAIPRLGIPAYNWWNECLHGVARAGIATVFPQAIGAGGDVRRRAACARWRWRSPTRRAPSTTNTCARATTACTRGSPSGRPTSTSSAIRAGAAATRPTASVPILTARLGVAYCRALQGDDPALPQAGRHAQALRRAQRPRGAAPQLRRRWSARRICARPTCRPSTPA